MKNALMSMSGWIFAAFVACAMFVVRAPRAGGQEASDAVASERRAAEAAGLRNGSGSPKYDASREGRRDRPKSCRAESEGTMRTARKALPFDLREEYPAIIARRLGDSALQVLMPYIMDEGEDKKTRGNAYYSLCIALQDMQDKEKAFGLALDLADKVNLGEGLFRNDGVLGVVLVRRFEDENGDLPPDGFAAALRTFRDMAKSGDRPSSRLAGQMYYELAGMQPPDDPDAVERVAGDMKALYADADADFADDGNARGEYLKKGKMLIREARWRYGESDKAAEWLARELEYARRKARSGVMAYEMIP